MMHRIQQLKLKQVKYIYLQYSAVQYIKIIILLLNSRMWIYCELTVDIWTVWLFCVDVSHVCYSCTDLRASILLIGECISVNCGLRGLKFISYVHT